MKQNPSWKGILFVFGTLILLLLGNFYWQAQRINKSFKEHSLTHSKVLGAVVELNIRNSMTNHGALETLIGHSLENTARFVRYLNQLEPFTAQELEAFAMASGLAGITIFSPHGKSAVEGPTGWLPRPLDNRDNGLICLPKSHLYLFAVPPLNQAPFSHENDGIVVGMSSEQMDKIQETQSVDHLIKRLNQMQGIEYVRFQPIEVLETQNTPPPPAPHDTRLIHINGRPVSETRITMGDKILVVGLEANYFSHRMASLKKELMVFISLLLILGGISSGWLYRLQQQRLEQTRIFERKMAKQLEQASLGRAAATITHEMRNPLNAISMGLQRLEMESLALEDDHRQLITSMRKAVERSNGVITHLQQYVRSFEPNQQEIFLAPLLDSLGVLYRPQCDQNDIFLDFQLDATAKVDGDANYLGQAFENLLKNAVEAQPHGGSIKVTLSKKETYNIIAMENPCHTLTSKQNQRVLDPYFTTKTYGTGLGLAISKKIIEAHSGRLEISCNNSIFSASIILPRA
ncbi:sensor histidine kinase [Desulfocicer niacini]